MQFLFCPKSLNDESKEICKELRRFEEYAQRVDVDFIVDNEVETECNEKFQIVVIMSARYTEKQMLGLAQKYLNEISNRKMVGERFDQQVVLVIKNVF